jgi:hypothetical protein
MKRPTRFPRKQPAQSLIELAITLTALIWLISGLVDLGMAFFSWVTLFDAAQEGAIYGSVHPDDTAGISTRVRETSTNPVDLSDTDAVAVITQTSDPACLGGWIQVTVNYDHVMFMPFFSGRIIPLHATVTDTILSPICP